MRFSVTVLRRLFRRLMAARSSGVDHGSVCLPILGFPTCVLAAEIKVLLSRVPMELSTASVKPCQFMSFYLALDTMW